MSPRAAWRLEELGFSLVYDYVAGKADWTAAGLPTEGHAGQDTLTAFVKTDVVTSELHEHLGDALERVANTGDLIVVINPVRVVLGRIRPSQITADAGVRVEQIMQDGPATVRVDENPHDLLQR